MWAHKCGGLGFSDTRLRVVTPRFLICKQLPSPRRGRDVSVPLHDLVLVEELAEVVKRLKQLVDSRESA